ncbi:MAG TPA: hypothetical protein VEZ47_13815 [Gemmatirosa sp.]|nr:hypothetical protein [Gemmatirosa sp.]
MLDAVREADGDTDADEAEGLYEDDEDAAEVDALLDEESGFDDDSSVAEIGARAADVTAAALLGAALGAGLGWLAYRSTRPEPRLDWPQRRHRGAARGPARASARAALLAEAVSEAARESADELRALVERTLRRELRGLTRAARRWTR